MKWEMVTLCPLLITFGVILNCVWTLSWSTIMTTTTVMTMTLVRFPQCVILKAIYLVDDQIYMAPLCNGIC